MNKDSILNGILLSSTTYMARVQTKLGANILFWLLNKKFKIWRELWYELIQFWSFMVNNWGSHIIILIAELIIYISSRLCTVDIRIHFFVY